MNGRLHTEPAEEQTARIEIEGGGSAWWYVCSECHGEVDADDEYCNHCKRRLIR